MSSPATAASGLSVLCRPWAWAGPIFDKELRCTARRRRYYSMRFGYLAVLTAFVALVWMETVGVSYEATSYGASRMSDAGRQIVAWVAWFQFVAMQLLAAVLLSTAVSDEIRQRTLAVLITAPISGFQFVLGKLMSKLLHLLILLAISLPVLAIVRVFGGVPWQSVLGATCVTLTATVLLGSISLRLSITRHRPASVVLLTVLVCGPLFALPSVWFRHVSRSAAMILSPFLMMTASVDMVVAPTGSGVDFWFLCGLHCLLMLVLSVLILAGAGKRIRPAALNVLQTGATNPSVAAGPARSAQTASRNRAAAKRKLRRITGSPLIWKELRFYVSGGRRTVIGAAIGAGVFLFLLYGLHGLGGTLDEDITHVSLMVIFFSAGVVTIASLAAATITQEKKSRALPILLTTPVSDWHVILAKAVGVFYRTSPAWILIAAHLLLFVIVGYVHPIAALHLSMVVLWVVVFLTGTGLYFSARLRLSSSAAMANVALGVMLWLIGPMLADLLPAVAGPHAGSRILWANPIVQVVVVTHHASGARWGRAAPRQLSYQWPGQTLRVGATTDVLLKSMLVYTAVGVLFAWRAKQRLRRDLFR